HSPVDLHNGDAACPTIRQAVGDVIEGAPPADAEGTGHRPQARQVVGCGGGNARLSIFARWDDDSIDETKALFEFALHAQPARAWVHDLDAHDTALARVAKKPPDFPPSHAEQRADLILRLVLVVVELGNAHGE